MVSDRGGPKQACCFQVRSGLCSLITWWGNSFTSWRLAPDCCDNFVQKLVGYLGGLVITSWAHTLAVCPDWWREGGRLLKMPRATLSEERQTGSDLRDVICIAGVPAVGSDELPVKAWPWMIRPDALEAWKLQ